MRTIAVTGANGYIGKHVVKQLANRGAQVVAIDVQGGDNEASDVRWVHGNIFDPDFSLESACDCLPDVLLHLAWRDGFNHNASTHLGDLSKHYDFLDRAISAGVPQVAVMGSMHEVGYWEGAIDENTPCNPLSLYGIAKDALRRALFVRRDQVGFKLQWLRGYYIYGDDEGSQSIFGKLYRAAQAGQETFPFTSGRNKYDFTPVTELADMIAAAVMQDEVDGIINCCSGNPTSLAERVEGFIKENNLDIKLEYGAFPDRPYDSPGVWGDPEKIHSIMQ